MVDVLYSRLEARDMRSSYAVLLPFGQLVACAADIIDRLAKHSKVEKLPPHKLAAFDETLDLFTKALTDFAPDEQHSGLKTQLERFEQYSRAIDTMLKGTATPKVRDVLSTAMASFKGEAP